MNHKTTDINTGSPGKEKCNALESLQISEHSRQLPRKENRAIGEQPTSTGVKYIRAYRQNPWGCVSVPVYFITVVLVCRCTSSLLCRGAGVLCDDCVGVQVYCVTIVLVCRCTV